MVVTDINQQKRKGRYNLYIDGEFYSGLDGEAIVKAGLKIGSEVSQGELEELVVESETRSAFEKLIKSITRTMHTKREIFQKLSKLGYNEKCINLAIKKAEEYGYINDEQYAKLFLEAKAFKSKREISLSMSQKGIDKQIINELLQNIDEGEETKRAKVLAQKYMKNKTVDKKTLSNLYAFLARKGFVHDSIQNVVRDYKFEEFED